MMISSTLREGVSAGLGRDDVRTVTVVLREPCVLGRCWLPIFPPWSIRLETGGKDIIRAGVIDGNEVTICCPGTFQLAVGTQSEKKSRCGVFRSRRFAPVWKLPPYFIHTNLTYLLEKKRPGIAYFHIGGSLY